MFQVLRRDLTHALRKKRPDVDLTSVILHQDNAPPHKAASTLLEIDLLGFELLNHPAYSPDLAPMDFKVFPEVKRQLKGIRFSSADELQNATQMIVRSFPQSWYVETFEKWIHRHEKCIRLGGDYVEK